MAEIFLISVQWNKIDTVRGLGILDGIGETLTF